MPASPRRQRRDAQQAGAFREGASLEDRVVAAMDLEREKGITISAKNTAIQHGDVKLNIIGAPATGW